VKPSEERSLSWNASTVDYPGDSGMINRHSESSRNIIMAGNSPTFEQIIQAVRHWPPRRRHALLNAISSLPGQEQALTAASRLRERHRMGSKKRRRMAELLGMANAGTITIAEKKELDRLVREFEMKTLALARDLVTDVNKSDGT
jgi:hypothetical protein